MRFPDKILIFVAHPDDETLGCGGRMGRFPDCVIAHSTDGSPLDIGDAQRSGFANREAYASARRAELGCALAQVGGRETRSLGLVDQQSWLDLHALTLSVQALIEEVRPAAIFTHPYEGGHPDHDAAAFAVQFACARLGAAAPERIEMAFYNRYEGRFHGGEFLPGPEPFAAELDPEDRAQKNRMLACFASQQGILKLFDAQFERWRVAPAYDFSQAPHEGPLNYETFGWGITSAMWRANAARAGDLLRT